MALFGPIRPDCELGVLTQAGQPPLLFGSYVVMAKSNNIFALNIYTFSCSPYPLFPPFEFEICCI